MQGRCCGTRCADDCIIGCELEADARRVMAVVPKRCNRFGLTIHPAKTAVSAFQKPPSRDPSARGTGTGDLLGLTHYWAKTRRGYWVIKRKTVRKRLRRFMRAIWTWCREHRHAPWHEPYRSLCAKLRGYSRTMVYVATARCLKRSASIPSGRGATGEADAATRATSTGRRVSMPSIANCRYQNPGSCTTARRARDSKVMRQTGCRLLG